METVASELISCADLAFQISEFLKAELSENRSQNVAVRPLQSWKVGRTPVRTRLLETGVSRLRCKFC